MKRIDVEAGDEIEIISGINKGRRGVIDSIVFSRSENDLRYNIVLKDEARVDMCRPRTFRVLNDDITAEGGD